MVRLEYGLLKRVGERSTKFEKYRSYVIAITERHVAASRGRQACGTGDLVCTKTRLKSAICTDNVIKTYLPYR